MKKLLFFSFIVFFTICTGVSFARIIPQDDSNVEYFYIAGPKADPLTGAEDHELLLHIDISDDEQGAVNIAVYDPDTGGDVDTREHDHNSWDTITKIDLYGSKGLIYEKKFGEGEYDHEYYYFDPLLKTDGVRIGDFYRFTLVFTAITGDDYNLFKVGVSPDNARVSSPNITFRLLSEEGVEMHFYPLVKKGITRLIVENYDMDEDGGRSLLCDPENKEHFEIRDSLSGQWSETIVTFTSTYERFLDYIITKATQKDGHAGLRITHMDDGSPVPIYFRKWPGLKPAVQKPVPKDECLVSNDDCNEFTFDATKSFDPDNQALTYRWDFGDRTTSNKPIVTHRYRSGGDYNVILTVKDNSGLECDTSISSQTVHVNEAPVANFTSPDSVCVGENVAFDASGTTDNSPNQLTFRWDFKDGTSAEGQQVVKSFDRGGMYNVKLVVNDNTGTLCDTGCAEKIITVNTSPVARAGGDIDICLQHNAEYRINFTGSGSMDADGDTLTYKWDFGDGSIAMGSNVSHVYKNGGEYVATLYVEDGSGSECSADFNAINVKLNRTPLAVAGDNRVVCQGAEILFDGSGSIGEEGEKLQYDWDFGDGTTGNGVKVAHTYDKGGSYNVILTVNDMQNTKCSSSMDSISVKVNSRPSSVFYGAGIACVGEEIPFDTKETNDPDGDSVTYSWDFGDGTKEQNISETTHAYKKGGIYSVRLTVDDGQGTECSKDVAEIKVKINTPPVADAGPNLVCCVDAVSEFDGSGSYDDDGDNLSYTWDFGDGTTGEGATVTHIYSKIGKYKVTLTVNDNSGTHCDSSTDSFTAVVNATPTSIIEVR